MTRTEIIQSLVFLQLMALPNDIRCRILQKHLEESTTPFTGWDVIGLIINDNVVDTTLDPADIITATTANSAPGVDGIEQKMYLFRETP